MRRRRYGSYRRNTYYGGNEILLAEFRFYNKSKQVIDNDVLDKIEERLKNGETKLYWTNDVFAKHGVGFKVYVGEKLSEQSENELYIKILQFDKVKFTAEQFNKTKYIFGNVLFLGFEPTTEQLDMLCTFEGEDFFRRARGEYVDVNKTGPEDAIIKMTWNEVVDFLVEESIINRFGDASYWDDYKKDVETLFGEMDIRAPKYQILRSENSNHRVNCYHIVNVIEKRINNVNYRVALTTIIGYYRESEYTMFVIPESHKDYTNIDENKVFFVKNKNRYFLDMSINEVNASGSRIINQAVLSLMERNIEEILPPEQIVITPMIYNFYKDRVSFLEDDDEYDHKLQLINAKYKELIEKGRTVKLNNVKINSTSIEVDDEAFKIEFPKKFLDVSKNINSIRKAIESDDARYNFNTLYEKLLGLSILRYVKMDWTRESEYKSFDGVSFTVNDMAIKVHKDNSRMKINGIFCRINDVYHVLTKAICYNDVKEYNRYIKDVSYIGVEWKQMISTGLVLELNNPFYSIFKKTGNTTFEKMIMRFSLLWDAEKRNNVYLLLNGEKFLIKYKGKFKRHFNLPRRSLTMRTLKKELNDCIEGVNNDMILSIVENAIEEAKIIQKRGEELVANTIKEVGAQEVEIDIKGNKIGGYKFKGRVTGTEYFVHKTTLSVYRYDNGNWNQRCVVDDHTKQRIFEDRLANRLVNIYNEPRKIFTLHN